MKLITDLCLKRVVYRGIDRPGTERIGWGTEVPRFTPGRARRPPKALDGGSDGVVLSGRDPDGLSGDVVVVTGRVVAPELGVVPHGLAAHRGREGGVVEDFRGDRGGLERDGPDPFARAVEEVHSSRCSARGSGRRRGRSGRLWSYTRRTRTGCRR
ncbi:MAG: hypothetical protein WBK56_07335 [Methanoculleus sp.]|jgi:hypothetical protein